MTHDYITMALGDPKDDGPARQVDAWYDTREGLEARLKAGLEGLREIARARYQAGYDRRERMAEWCILGMFWTDTESSWAMNARNRAESRMPAIPTTR